MSDFQIRYQQAKLYARQVRARKAMGDSYAHAKPWRPTPLPGLLRRQAG